MVALLGVVLRKKKKKNDLNFHRGKDIMLEKIIINDVATQKGLCTELHYHFIDVAKQGFLHER